MFRNVTKCDQNKGKVFFKMILVLLEYIFIAIFFVIVGFYIITLIACAMIMRMFHVKHGKGKNGKFENSNNIKTDDTEHNKP